MVGLEDELVALLEQDPERRRRKELEEGEPAASQRGDGGPHEEGRRAELENDVEGVERHRSG